MPESERNVHRQSGEPRTFSDDYLPDYFPRPKYVIATIYPPVRDPSANPERETVDGDPELSFRPSRKPPLMSGETGLSWHESSLGIAPDKVARSGTGSADVLMGTPGNLGIFSSRSEPSITAPVQAGKNLTRMEVPRGKFRSLERNASLISVLRGLHLRSFRGSCRMNLNGSLILLVFDEGKIILAAYQGFAGDAALERVCMHRFARVDALISDLDDAQIRLSLEFNQAWKVESARVPSCIATPERILHDSENLAFATAHEPKPVTVKEINPVKGEDVLPAHAGAGSFCEPAGKRGEQEETPDLAVDRDSLQVEEPGAGWKSALAIPVTSPENSGTLHEMDVFQKPDEPAGWKRAISMPIAATEMIGTIPAKTTQIDNIRELPATGLPPAWVPEFELITTDTGLFDDVPVRKKIAEVSAPEPAEQWKSMGGNRQENSSV